MDWKFLQLVFFRLNIVYTLSKRDLINGKLTKDGSVANVIIDGNDCFM